jgi:hypothetical protein
MNLNICKQNFESCDINDSDYAETTCSSINREAVESDFLEMNRVTKRNTILKLLESKLELHVFGGEAFVEFD